MVNIKSLKLEFGYNGKVVVDIWANCHSKDDCDQMIAWLQVAKKTMADWEKISQKAEVKPAAEIKTVRSA